MFKAIAIACAAFVSLPGLAMAQSTCDQLWTAITAVPGNHLLPPRAEGMAEDVYRYVAGAEMFVAAHDSIGDETPESLAAEGSLRHMGVALGLSFGDQLMRCYRDAAAADPSQGGFVDETETAYPEADRAALVTLFRLPG